jgi:hypothetical protein
MNPQSEDLARAVTNARLAAGRQQQLARLAKETRRDTRPVGRPLVRVRWWRRWSGRRVVARTPSTAAAPEHAAAGIEGILDLTAQRVVANGTRSEAPVLCAMSLAARRVSPGAAAALVDWDGPEPVRLRAFGIVHGAVLRGLDAPARQALLGQLMTITRAEAGGPVAVDPVDVSSRQLASGLTSDLASVQPQPESGPASAGHTAHQLSDDREEAA